MNPRIRIAALLSLVFLSGRTPAAPPPYGPPVIGGKTCSTTAPTNGQTLAYSSGTGQWTPATPAITSIPVPIASGGTGSTTQNFVDLSSTQASIAGAKTFTTSPFTVAGTVATVSGTSLTLNGAGSSKGVIVQANGTTYVDFGVSGGSFIALGANIFLGSVGGTGGLSFGSMSGDTTLPTGALTWNADSGKALNLVGAADSIFSSTVGTLTLTGAAHTIIGASGTGVDLASASTTTAILGNATMAAGKTLVVGGTTIIDSSGKLAGGQLASGTVASAALASNAIVAAALSTTSMRMFGGTGLVAAGAVTLTGAKVGDTVVGVVGTVSGTITSDFEATITVNNQIQQTAGSIATDKLTVLLVAKGG